MFDVQGDVSIAYGEENGGGDIVVEETDTHHRGEDHSGNTVINEVVEEASSCRGNVGIDYTDEEDALVNINIDETDDEGGGSSDVGMDETDDESTNVGSGQSSQHAGRAANQSEVPTYENAPESLEARLYNALKKGQGSTAPASARSPRTARKSTNKPKTKKRSQRKPAHGKKSQKRKHEQALHTSASTCPQLSPQPPLTPHYTYDEGARIGGDGTNEEDHSSNAGIDYTDDESSVAPASARSPRTAKKSAHTQRVSTPSPQESTPLLKNQKRKHEQAFDHEISASP